MLVSAVYLHCVDKSYISTLVGWNICMGAFYDDVHKLTKISWMLVGYPMFDYL